MERNRYLNYIPPSEPHVNWSDEQLFDEVDFIATHRIEIRPTGERDAQLKLRMGQAVCEQMIRYNMKKKAEEESAWAEHGN
jgi:hypothetical protein